jgi:hypothetical protein
LAPFRDLVWQPDSIETGATAAYQPSTKSRTPSATPKRGESKPKQASKPEPPFYRWFIGSIFNLLRRHGNVIAAWVGAGFIARQVSLAFIAYAGRDSTANLSFSILASVSFVWTASVTMTGLSATFYIRERRLHRRTRERLAARITELELKIDPARTSSLLTSEGLTRKGDE